MNNEFEGLPFHRKYRPNTLNGYIGNAKLKETAMSALKLDNKPQVILLYGDSGCGKAQPLDSLVLTTQGYIQMKDVKIGTEVYTHKGNKGKVTGIYPQGIRPIYRLVLEDNTYIEVSDEHLNLVWTKNKLEPLVLTTKQLIDFIEHEGYYISRQEFYAPEYFVGLDFAEIVKIEYIGDEECQCIMIDHEDHTYISNYFIPTHNTTFARLLAKEYSCENRNTETGACNECFSCSSINEYIATGNTNNITNIKEIDITEQSGKNDLTSVLEDMEIPVFGDEWKIYIFDETHQASNALQNRLLKITEEPPEHVLIIFCTTNPEKLIPTLKNRCQLKLHVTKPKVKELGGLLKYVCDREGVKYDKEGLEFIANRGELTIRTALQNLQQVITEQNNALYNSAIKVFETVSNDILSSFFRALKNGNVFEYVNILYKVKTTMELDTFLTELKTFITRGIYTINGIDQDGITEKEYSIYRSLFDDIGIAEISYLLDRVLSMDKGNLEIQLLMLGYQGLDLPKNNTSTEQFSLSNIIDIPNELDKENNSALKNIKENDKITTEKGIENADKLSEDADIDSLLALGGILIE